MFGAFSVWFAATIGHHILPIANVTFIICNECFALNRVPTRCWFVYIGIIAVFLSLPLEYVAEGPPAGTQFVDINIVGHERAGIIVVKIDDEICEGGKKDGCQEEFRADETQYHSG